MAKIRRTIWWKASTTASSCSFHQRPLIGWWSTVLGQKSPWVSSACTRQPWATQDWTNGEAESFSARTGRISSPTSTACLWVHTWTHWSPSLTRWLCIYHCSSLFKYCDIVIKHKHYYKHFPCSVFWGLVLFDVQSFDVRSLSKFGLSTFSLSTFGPIWRSVFRCSVPFKVQSFDVRSFSMFSIRGSVFRHSVFQGSVMVL